MALAASVGGSVAGASAAAGGFSASAMLGWVGNQGELVTKNLVKNDLQVAQITKNGGVYKDSKPGRREVYV